MPRPAKAVEMQSGNLTKQERETRLTIEKKLKGGDLKIRAPAYLTKSQKDIFKFLIKELKASEILSNLDGFVLETASIAIDRLREMEEMTNVNKMLLTDRTFVASKRKYTQDFFRCCNELCLSPQARAKIGSLSLTDKKEDPIEAVLRGEDVDGNS